MKRLKLVILSSLLVMTSACATKPYAPVQFQSSQTEIKSIALADDVVKDMLDANKVDSNMSMGYSAGGPLGLLLVTAFEGGETIARKNALKDIMDATDFDAETEFQTLMRDKLAAAGYENAPVAGKRRKRRELLSKVPKTDADAVLDVSMTNFGVQKSDIGENWKPAAAVEIRLMSADGKTVLMDNKISYNQGMLNDAKEQILRVRRKGEGVGYYKIKDIDGELMAGEMRVMLDNITDVIMLLLKPKAKPPIGTAQSANNSDI